jgi:non-specific serine/threonine protein kinase
LIDSKKGLSDELLAGGGEINLTEMRDDELLQLVRLDLTASMRD